MHTQVPCNDIQINQVYKYTMHPSHKIGGPPRRRIIAADRALRMAGRLPVGNGIAQKIAAEPSGQGAGVCAHMSEGSCVCKLFTCLYNA